MSRVILGNHLVVMAARSEQNVIRKFYGDSGFEFLHYREPTETAHREPRFPDRKGSKQEDAK